MAAEHSARGLLNAVLVLSSSPSVRRIDRNDSLFDQVVYRVFLQKVDKVRQRGMVRPEFFLLGDGAIALKDSLAPVPWHVRVTSAPRNTIALMY